MCQIFVTTEVTSEGLYKKCELFPGIIYWYLLGIDLDHMCRTKVNYHSCLPYLLTIMWYVAYIVT